MSKSYTRHLVVHGQRNILGKLVEMAHVYYDNNGELVEYQIYDENIDDWVCLDISKMPESYKSRLQEKIDLDISLRTMPWDEDAIYENYTDLKRG